MLRFVAKRTRDGKLFLGLCILPEDLQALMTGQPELTTLADIDCENPVLDEVGVYFFRDVKELNETLRELGLAVRTGVYEPGTQARFVAPPAEKITEN